MAKEAPVPPYKYTAWPAMRYNPETGAHVICHSEKDVPEGYVDSLTKVIGAADGAPLTTVLDTDVVIAQPKPTKAKGKAKPDGVTLKSLKLNRKDALALLDEEDAEYDEDASDNEIAALVKELLDDDDSE